MAHRLPTRHLRATDLPDPDAINEVVLPLADKLSGGINEHDIHATQNPIPVTKVEENAYYKPYYIAVGPSPSLTSDLSEGRLTSAWAQTGEWKGQDSAPILDSVAWQSLVGGVTGTELKLSFGSGQDKLFIVGWGTYFSWRGDSTNARSPPQLDPHDYPKDYPLAALTDDMARIPLPLRVQFALRVDGVVRDNTITGAAVFPDPPPFQLYRSHYGPQTTLDGGFDTRHIDYVFNTTGLNAAAHPFRMVQVLSVQAGTRTVDVVGRRLPPEKKDEILVDGATNRVEVFNRQLFVLRIKGFSAGDSGVPSVAVVGMDDGDVLSAASLFTDRLSAVSTNMNDLGGPELERGALHEEHLPSIVEDTDIVTIHPNSSVPWGGVYPGYGTNGAGWGTVNNGAGRDLRANNGGAGWDFTNKDGVLLVLANVEVPRLATGGDSDSLLLLGVLALAYTNGAGVRNVVGTSEAYVNAHNPYLSYFNGAELEGHKNIESDVPLVYVLDTRTLTNRTITSFEVLVSGWNANSLDGTGVDVYTQSGILAVVFLRGLSL